MSVRSATFAIAVALLAGADPDSRQASGVKVGEVTTTSAIVWMRVTAQADRRADGVGSEERPPRRLADDVNVADLHGTCPGAPGQVRLRWGTQEDLAEAQETPWVDVAPENDFTHHFRLTDLEPATVHYYSAETTGPGGSPVHAPLRGRFETAPTPDRYADVTFTSITGQAYRDLDDPEGFRIYEAMGRLRPQFIVPTGDTVYYDSDPPLATSVALARYHWQRVYSLPRVVEFHLNVPGYWEKDDHDTHEDDCWPTQISDKVAPFTFDEGLRVYREQVPMSELPYRTFRWGKGLQVWLVEGRDFRSPNDMPDGPEKSIWGDEQKQWLYDTVLASDADWKVLVSPTPIIGPDRATKADNHANAAFAHEGQEFRRWVQANVPDRFFIVCGDRHWQYHSVDPETSVHEFSVGPASDEHAGGSPGLDRDYHRFHRVEGGFLSVTTARVDDQSTIAFRLHDVLGRIVYEQEWSRPAR